MLVNQHLGEARQLWVFEKTDDGSFELVEPRETPPAGGGAERWKAMARLLHDCRALLTSSAGQTPVAALEKAGIQTVLMEGLIEEGLDAIYRGVPVRAPLRRRHRCGSGCSGTATGCG
jgi:nitrogen fixation protein NifB